MLCILLRSFEFAISRLIFLSCRFCCCEEGLKEGDNTISTANANANVAVASAASATRVTHPSSPWLAEGAEAMAEEVPRRLGSAALRSPRRKRKRLLLYSICVFCFSVI